MEGNSTDGFGTQNTSSSTTVGGTSDAGFTRDASTDSAGLADRARDAAGTAGDKLADVGSAARERAGNLKDTLVNALESGAERLRAQGAGGGQVAGAAATGTSVGVVAETPQLGAAANQIAGGMQGAADWLRDADLDGLKAGVERQVKEHPGRTLAVALGLGYLLGKAFRK